MHSKQSSTTPAIRLCVAMENLNIEIIENLNADYRFARWLKFCPADDDSLFNAETIGIDHRFQRYLGHHFRQQQSTDRDKATTARP